MIVHTEHVDIPADRGVMRCFVAAPQAPGRWPAIVFFSDIFQLTGTMPRSCVRLAGHGFVVLAPEIYAHLEAPGTVIPFDDAGRARGLANATRTEVAQFDAGTRLAIDHLAAHASVAPGQIGAAGFCIGGHLAFRAALQPEVRATVCFYGTGIHDGRLGSDADAGSLPRAAEIRGKLLLVWGLNDPHIPEAGRRTIEQALRAAGTDVEQRLYAAEHAFMRDEGPRHDPEATDQAFAEMVRFYRAAFGR